MKAMQKGGAGVHFRHEVVQSLVAHGFYPSEVMELIGIEDTEGVEDQFCAEFADAIAAGEALLKAHPENVLPILEVNRRAAAGDLEALAELARQHPDAARQVLGLTPPT